MARRKSFSDIALEKYIDEKSENAQILEFNEAINQPGVESYFYDDLPNTEVKGFPFASDLADKEGNAIDYKTYCALPNEEKKKFKLRFHYLPKMHELYIGATGAGKTTTCIEPQLRAITSQKNKPNVFISDPKGEIFEHNVKHLKDMGYKIQILNFKNVKFSHCWNPLDDLYKMQMAIPNIGKKFEVIQGDVVDTKYTKMSDAKEFNHGSYVVCDGLAFPTKQSFNNYVNTQKFIAHAEVSTLANQLCYQMFPASFKTNDPTWSNGAREMYNGFILGLLEHAANPKLKFKKEMMNIITLNDLYTLATKYDIDRKFNQANQILDKFIENTSKEAADKMELVIKSANVTRRGFLSTAQTMIAGWMNGHIFSLVLNSNIDLDDSKQPIALFIVTRDYDKSDNIVAGTYLNLVYRYFYLKAEKAEKEQGVSASRPLHFMLDEFANIPPIPDFETKIATARSKNIWFHIYLQSYEQLTNVYNQNISNIIIDNCNHQAFMGCQSQDSKERFARECGKHTIRGIDAATGAMGNNTITAPVVPVSDLDTIKTGELYIKRIRSSVIKANALRSYECAEAGFFKDFFGVDISKYTPINLTNPGEMKYRYQEIFQEEWLKDTDEEQDDDFLFEEDWGGIEKPETQEKTKTEVKKDESSKDKPGDMGDQLRKRLNSSFKKK